MRFDKQLSRKKQKEVEEQQVAKEEPPEPTELEEAVHEESKKVEPQEEVKKVVEELKTKEVYETEKGETVLQYDKSKEKGYCQLRERTKAVYGIKYAAGKGMDIARKARAAIMDWCNILPKKSNLTRKDKEDLI